MKRLGKGLAILVTIVSLLFGSGGSTYAVFGIPDDVPAATLLFPFLKVNPTRTSNNTQDTLIVVTNTSGIGVEVHLTLWSVDSVHKYDFNVNLTPHDVWSCSVFDLLFGSGCQGVAPAPSSIRDDPTLRVSLRGQTFVSGYITADAVPSITSDFPGVDLYPIADCNILIGHQYIVNLPAGSSTGFNAVHIEHGFPQKGQPVELSGPLGPAPSFLPVVGFYYNRCVADHGGRCFYDWLERIDGPNGDLAQTGTDDGPGLKLLVRYFTASAIQGQTELWVWKDRNTSSSQTIGIGIYDEDEILHSVTVPLTNEVNVLDMNGLITPGAPGGWFRLNFLTSQFGTDPSAIQAVAYALHTANSSNASLRWDAIFPAARQYTNFIGVPE
jgi:hypothetical protein